MPKPKVLATRPFLKRRAPSLTQHATVDYWKQPDRISREELIREIEDKQGLVCLLTEHINDELLHAAPKLRIASKLRSALNNIDVAACTNAAL